MSSEDDAEVRRVSITNNGARTREIEVTSYAEVVLAPGGGGRRAPGVLQPVRSRPRASPERDTLLATRRPRSPEDAEIWLAHVLAVEGETIGDLEWETDRAQFLGRGRTLRDPRALTGRRARSRTPSGAVLDPIVSLRRRVRVRPGKTVRVAFSTLVGVVARARCSTSRTSTTTSRPSSASRRSPGRRRRCSCTTSASTPDEAHLFQTLGGSILYADRALRASAEVLARRVERRRGALGARDLGRPADRARGDRRRRRHRHRAAAAARARSTGA